MLRSGSESVAGPAGENVFRPAGGAPEGLALRLFNHPSRAACTVLSIGYFGLLWLGDGWPVLLMITGFLYVFLTMPRWRDLGLDVILSLIAPALFLYTLFEALHGPLGLPLLAHFAVVAPAVFLCVTPLGVTLPRFSAKGGRASFILLALPFFLLLGSQYWPELNRALGLIWGMVWSPIDRVTSEAVLVVSFFMFLRLWARLADIGVSRRVGYVVLAALGLRHILGGFEPVRAYGPMVDLFLAAGIFMLCIWPGRPEPDQ